ncbi:MAG TPA: hypothetical protein VG843_04045 [Rhizomicrobium sp.]|jgi:hypothetical protein|nr:hypothetical protein [Rhizomicrobium sp.]
MKIISPFLSLFEIYNGMLITPAPREERQEPQSSKAASEAAETSVAEMILPALTLAANS